MTLGIDGKDAVHIAFAIEGKAELFFTTDIDIIRLGKNIRGIKIMNPVQYFTEPDYADETI
jgi:predicted nucleic acid-binding protein